MGEAQKRLAGLGVCIYCNSSESLSDEHVLPYAMGGQIVLRKASCPKCARVTGQLEQRLLRGHWWPYRKRLGLQTRNPDASKELKSVRIHTANGETLDAKMPLESFVAAMIFEFEPPSILSGSDTKGRPFAKNVGMKVLGELPTEAKIGSVPVQLSTSNKVEFPVNFNSDDLTRFLAKVAHGYAISKEGLAAFDVLYLPKYILGQTDGIMTYVGGYESPILAKTLPGGGYNRMMIRSRGDLLSVCLQFFVDRGDPPPIYEVVVGKKHS